MLEELFLSYTVDVMKYNHVAKTLKVGVLQGNVFQVRWDCLNDIIGSLLLIRYYLSSTLVLAYGKGANCT